MTTTTQQERARADSFDDIIGSRRTGSAPDTPGEWGGLTSLPSEERADATRVSFTIVVVALLAVAVAVLAILALIAVPQGAAGAAPTTGGAGEEVTGATIVAQVELGWTAAGGTGSADCPEPASQEPGTVVECTGTYDSRPLVFTAVVGDPSLGEPRVMIASWSEVVGG